MIVKNKIRWKFWQTSKKVKTILGKEHIYSFDETPVRKRFITKLVVGLFLLSVIPVLFLGILAYVFTNHLSDENLQKYTAVRLNNFIRDGEVIISNYLENLKALSKDQEISDIFATANPSNRELNILFQKLFLAVPASSEGVSMHMIQKLDSLNETGFRLHTNAKLPPQYDPKIYAGWGVFRVAQNSDEPSLYSNIYQNSKNEKNIISLVVGIKQTDQVVGYIIIDLTESVFQEILQNGQEQFDSFRFLITSKEGLLLFDSKDQKQDIYLADKQLMEKSFQHSYHSYRGINMYTAGKHSATYNLYFVAMTDISIIEANNQFMWRNGVLAILISFLTCIGAAILFTKSLTKPIKKIIRTIEKIEHGEYDLKIDLQSDDEIGYLAFKFDEALTSLNYYYNKNLEKQKLMRITQMKNLQAQINPHFFYNTLDTVKWLAKLNGVEEISQIVTKLGLLLKNSMAMDKDVVTIKESLKLIDCYISIEKIRYGERFEFISQIDESLLEYAIPNLLLQPIIENAIIHGIEEKSQNGKIRLTIKKIEKFVFIRITDNGIGIDDFSENKRKNPIEEKEEYAIPLKNLAGNQIALDNIDKRIKLFYGEKYAMQIWSKKNMGTVITLYLPLPR